MGAYRAAVVTAAGQNIIAQALADVKAVEFTSAKTSSYLYPSGTNITGLTGLQDVEQSVIPFAAQVMNGNVVQVSVRFDNDEITQQYPINTIGLYAKVKDGEEVLFSVIQAIIPDEMPVHSDVSPSAFIYNIQHTVQNAAQITIVVNPAGTATVQDIYGLTYPEFEDYSAEGAEAPDARTAIEEIKSKKSIFGIMSNIKAALKGLVTLGEMKELLVNNGLCNIPGQYFLDAAFGKNLQDQVTDVNNKTKSFDGTLDIATSILQKALDVSNGFYVYRLGGTYYNGDDLPHGNYAFGVACIYKRNEGSISVVINPPTPHNPLIINTYDKGWGGWKTYVTDADFFQASEYLDESTTIKTIQTKMDKITRNRTGFATVARDSPLVGRVDTGICIYNPNSALILTSSRIGVFRNTSESVKWIGDENLSLSPTTNFDEIAKSGYGWLSTFGATSHGTGSPGAIRTGEGVFESIVYSSTIILQRWNVNGYGVMFRQKTGSSWQSWRSIPYV